MCVAQVRHAMNDTGLSSEQCRRQDGKRRIFRAADLNGTRKRMAAVDEDLIHTWQKGTVSHLNNRFSNKCLGNFFPPGPKEGARFGRVRFPRPAIHRAEGGMAPVQSVQAPTHRPARWRKARPRGRAELRAKEYGAAVLRCKEGSRQSDRRFLRYFRGDCFSQSELDPTSSAWLHSLAQAQARRQKCRQRQAPRREIWQPNSTVPSRC